MENAGYSEYFHHEIIATDVARSLAYFPLFFSAFLSLIGNCIYNLSQIFPHASPPLHTFNDIYGC
jgi:hypothetical protein